VARNVGFMAAGWMGLALLASLVSIRLGVSVALIEIGLGVLGGNVFGFQTTPWIDFLATFGSGLLTFLAGAEIEPEALKRHLKPTLVIGSLSFSAPFLGAWISRSTWRAGSCTGHGSPGSRCRRRPWQWCTR